MEKQKKKLVQISLRIEEDKLKEYKKWLIDNGYRSINEHLNKVIEEVLKSRYCEKQWIPIALNTNTLELWGERRCLGTYRSLEQP